MRAADRRPFFRRQVGASIGHASPEAAEGGTIALVVDETVLAAHQQAMEQRALAAWQPLARERVVSPALQAYAALTTNAARGTVRDVSQIARRRRAALPACMAPAIPRITALPGLVCYAIIVG